MKIIKMENELVPFYKAVQVIKKSFVFRPNIEDKMRALMSEKTQAALRTNVCYIGEGDTAGKPASDYNTLFGIKVLIDNDIPFGECEIFINAMAEIEITSEK